MKKSVWISVIVVAAVLVIGGLLLANKNSSNSSSSSAASTDDSATSQSTSNNSSSPTTSTSVDIRDMAFSPADITIKVGESVTWTNSDSVAHTVAVTSGPETFESSTIDTGKTFTHAFNKTGTYKYHCSIHPNMTGTVTVTE